MSHTPTPFTYKADHYPHGEIHRVAIFADAALMGAKHPAVADTIANAEFICRAVNSHDALLAALREIARGEGEYSRNTLTHASNTIEHMKEIAKKAIEAAEAKL